VRVTWDTIATKVDKRLINEGLLDAKKIAYLLHFVPLSSENWNSRLEVP
jgi:hypothetical protein